MRHYSDQLRRTGRAPLQMRVGVNTGEVVVRSIRKEDLHTDYVPVGLSTNLAARMEQVANPGSILVTAYTQKLTEGYFEFKPLGATKVKGVEEPLDVYEVLGAGPLRTRLQVALGTPLMATKGYAAPEVERLYTQARNLCQQVGETPQLFPVLWGLWVFYETRAEYKTGRELGEQCLTLAGAYKIRLSSWKPIPC